MSAASASRIVRTFTDAGADVVVAGGWAVDALVGTQTRQHSDLDLWLPAAHLGRAVWAASSIGIDRLFPAGDDRPWNIVLHNLGRLRIDLHLYEQIDASSVHFGSVNEPYVFPVEALSGMGTIAGTAVRCESAEWIVRWHQGYQLRDVDRHDVELLCNHFGMPVPDDYQ